VLVLAFVGVAAIAVTGLVSFFQALGQVESAAPSVVATFPGASPSPSPTPSPSLSPSPSPSPTADPAGPALDALGDVLTAIEAARGGHDGLNGSEAGELNDRALLIGRQLRDGDYAAARQTATDLQDRVASLKLDKKRGEALQAAIEDLIAAIPS
jgi:hypothetical protein